jgi:uncharacterized zinc-type alcohol dehydrogenase-like protein
MSQTIKAYAATSAGAPLEPFEYEPGPLGSEEVEIAVQTCGICHSDLSMLQNDWHMTKYPLVPGHEVTGKIVAVGEHVKKVRVGDTVGLGWNSASCMACEQCLGGNHNLCARSEGTIVQRHGGFANRVRAHWAWAVPLPEGVDPAKAGPLFCGGITVFNPIVQFGVRPTDRVGVVGIGGLGHLAVKFLSAWGCEVTAFTSSDSKTDEAKKLGAHHVVNSRNADQLKKIVGSLDFVLSTVNVELDWPAFIDALAPKGRLHSVGAVDKPVSLPVFPLLVGQKSFSASPLGSPATTAKMLEFCARHQIVPQTEHFKMSQVNDAMEHLKSGKARYRIVLESDFAV